MYPQIVAAWDRRANEWRFNGTGGRKTTADFEAAMERGDTALVVRIRGLDGRDNGADIASYVPLRYEDRSPSAVESGIGREDYEARIAANLVELRAAWRQAQADAAAGRLTLIRVDAAGEGSGWNIASTGAPLLIRVGTALYGARWQSEVARALGVSDRTVRRWIADGADLSPGIRADLRRLVQERRDDLAALAAELD